MDKNANNLNDIYLAGKIVSEFQFSHRFKDTDYMIAYLLVDRLSREKDLIPILVPSDKLTPGESYKGKSVEVFGQVRSYLKTNADSCTREVRVFAKGFIVSDQERFNAVSNNRTELCGMLQNSPTYWQTPGGRRMCTFLLIVGRGVHEKKDYIPCIIWSDAADEAQFLPAGTRIYIKGRFQSRDFKKRVNGQEENRTAYELSSSEYKVVG